MQAVILAAGKGSRLKQHTQSIPKALVQVAGKPLLSYAIAFARLVGCEEIVVVVGTFGHKVVNYLSTLGVPGLRWVENPDFHKGNLYSLGAARKEVRMDFLLLNTDHIYRRAIAERVRCQCADKVVAFCDHDRSLGADDMKVSADRNGSLRHISKQLSVYDCGYVGMTFCPESRLPAYFHAFDQVEARYGEPAVVEMVLGELAQNDSPPWIGDISGVGWLEIDTAEELTQADKIVRETPENFAFLELK